MGSCSYCNSFILFGGARDQTGRYCNEKCQRAGHLLLISRQIPDETLQGLTTEIHQGNCPKCKGSGPVDVHKAHTVWSAFVLTSWSSSPEVSCKKCAVKRQIGATLFSGTLGWWGFPWGILMTPLQVIRNIIEMIGGPSSSSPSLLLHRYVGMQAAAHFVASGQGASQNTPVVTAVLTPPPLPDDDTRYQPK